MTIYLSFMLCSLFVQTLTTLDLSWNGIGTTGAQHLAQAIPEMKVKINCSFHFFHLHYAVFIQTLTTLNLSDNEIEDQGAQHLAQALRNNTVRS